MVHPRGDAQKQGSGADNEGVAIIFSNNSALIIDLVLTALIMISVLEKNLTI